MEIGLKSKCSHVASAMSCVDVLCDTYNAFPDAIIILSKGHGALAQYVILNEMGKLPDEILATYYKDGGLGIHPSVDIDHGIYASTGSLGNGLAIGIGYAIANPENKVFVILSDGEMDEGGTLSAFKLINRLGVKNCIPVIDWNDLDAFGERIKEEWMEFKYRKYYSIKANGWGELENKFESHYATVTDDIYKEWCKNEKSIEKNRVKIIKEAKKMIKLMNKDRESNKHS